MRRCRALAALLVVAQSLLFAAGTALAQGAAGGVGPRRLRIEAWFVDRGTGSEAPWGATGQIMIAAAPGDPAAEHWRQVRTVASSPSRQSVLLSLGERGLVRVGRQIPFAGWFLRHGNRCGLLEAGTEWREVESALEVEVGPAAADGSFRITVTPEFGYQHGRSRRVVSFTGDRAEILVPAGVETRFAPPAAQEDFYRRLLAGYDPLRRVWSVDMILRVDPEP